MRRGTELWLDEAEYTCLQALSKYKLLPNTFGQVVWATCRVRNRLNYRTVFDNAPEFLARTLRTSALIHHSDTATIRPGKLWKNKSFERSHTTFLRERLVAKELAHLRKKQIVIEQWPWEYNGQQSRSCLGYRTPAEVGAEARAAMKSESKL